MPWATRSMSAMTAPRVLSETARTVPQRVAVSGMTLLVVPARILATVTTAGSKASTRRVTMAWKAVTISQAIGIGSEAWWGIDAWPPRPRTVISKSSAEAIRAWPREAIIPDGQRGGLVDGEGHRHRLRAGSSRVEQALLEHEAGAVVALLARLEHERDPTPQPAAPRGEQPGTAGQHGDVAVVAAGVHGVVDPAGEVEVGVLVHGEGVHVAPEQHGRTRLGAVEDGDHRRRRGAQW